MKKHNMIVIFMTLWMAVTLLNGAHIYGDEIEKGKLNVSVLAAGENVNIVDIGSGYFANGEVELKIQDGINDENANKLILMSLYDGKEFSEYKELENGKLSLKPNNNTAYDFKAVKFKEVCTLGEKNYIFESDVVCINFDNVSPVISGERDTKTLMGIPDGTKYKIKVTDDGGIKNITLSNNAQQIDYIELCKLNNQSPDGDEESKNDFKRITEYEYTLTLNAGEQSNSISVVVEDVSGNKSEFGFEYLVDNGAPAISISGIENGKVYGKSAEFKIDVTDNMKELYSYYKCTYTGANGESKVLEEELSKIEESSFSISKNYSTEGIYDIEFYAKDCLGNTTDTYYLSFAVDANPPLVQIANIESGKIYKSGVEVYCVVSEMFYTGVDVSVSVERASKNIPVTPFNMAAKTSKLIYKFVEDGDYRIIVKAKDSMGYSSVSEAFFTIDSIAPEISVTNDSGIVDGAAFITKAPQFNVKVTGDTSGTSAVAALYRVAKSGIYEKITERSFVDSKNDILCPFEVEEDGEYVISVVAYDKAGNKSSQNTEFTLDMNPPVIGYIDAFNEKFLKAFTLPKNLKDYIKDTTAVKYRAYLNEEEIGFGDVKGDGRYLLQITAMDEAGNTSEGMAAFIVDSTAPKIVVSGLKKDTDTATVDKGDVINVSLLDEDDWFEKVTVNGIEVQVNRTKKTLDFRVDNFGEYNVEILARDYAGNETTEVINTKCLSSGIDAAPNITMKTLTKNEAKNREIFSREKPSLGFFVFCGFIFATSVIFVVFALFDIKKIKC